MDPNDMPFMPPGFIINTPSPQALNAVERYDGCADAHAWLNILNGLAQLYNWSDEACLTIASLRMTGRAQTWLQARHHADWAEFQESFLERFGETKETAIARFEACFQYPGESPKAFADRYLQYMEKAGRAVDDTTVYTFIERLQPDLRSEAARHRFETIDDAVSYCDYWLAFDTPTTAPEPGARFADKPYHRARGTSHSEFRPPAAAGYKDGSLSSSNMFESVESDWDPRPPGYRHPFQDLGNTSREATQPTYEDVLMYDGDVISQAALDELARRFEILESNFTQYADQQLVEKDRGFSELRHALQLASDANAAEINYLHDGVMPRTGDELGFGSSGFFRSNRKYPRPQGRRNRPLQERQNPAASGCKPINTASTIKSNYQPPRREEPLTTADEAAVLADRRGREIAAAVCRMMKANSHEVWMEGHVQEGTRSSPANPGAVTEHSGQAVQTKALDPDATVAVHQNSCLPGGIEIAPAIHATCVPEHKAPVNSKHSPDGATLGENTTPCIPTLGAEHTHSGSDSPAAGPIALPADAGKSEEQAWRFVVSASNTTSAPPLQVPAAYDPTLETTTEARRPSNQDCLKMVKAVTAGKGLKLGASCFTRSQHWWAHCKAGIG